MDMHLDLFKRISNNDDKAFEVLFKEYYKFLCSFAFGITKDHDAAEEIVEEFFFDLWNNRHKLVINTSVRSYFVGAVHHRSINYLQRIKPRYLSVLEITNLIDREGTAGDKLITPEAPQILSRDLTSALEKAISNLPPACKEVFLLSRFQDMNYKEISEKLNISVNTVKTQIKIALGKLRTDLKDYIAVFLMFIF